ncbi:hypothetical protein PR202_gb05060 [Eleusine coracana subsp. coracana]|uniref:Transcription factor IIIC 90kDa subunit N-terminal domain-containing protein n=1 Tax=Eleusine coracana subsp. coracana TaxID=191504 RepID=A0AAV5E6Y8_ELECO|nr:hypothetical protein PR202_gb05060 [Eleusine coracana subsp. coracana]
MAPHYQAATLIAAPCYPDAIAWSNENLVAVASGHLVTILNPDALEGPRQVIVLRHSDPFPIGVVNREGKISLSHVWCPLASHVILNHVSSQFRGLKKDLHLIPGVLVGEELNHHGNDTAPLRHHVLITKSRDAGYIYDDNEDDSHAVKDADFSLELCSNKSKKRPLGKVVNHGQGRSQNTKAPLSSNEASKSLPHITAKQYACRDALLSSLIVAWSPVLSSSDRVSYLSRDWCILAVGSKSGNVSFWKVCKPEYYTIDVGLVSREPMLIGVLQAHKSWVSAISLEVSSTSSSKSSLLLATGCSDGSVKIWSGDIEGLHLFTGAGEVPFVLVAEITADVSAPVSSISLSASARLQPEVNLAIGRVSGSLETWMWNACSNEIENTSACHAHDQVVTGLSWGLDGHCLYSCSQDNSVHCWITQGKNLEQIPMHTYFPEIKESTDLSEVSDRCFGLTLAPGQQMIAVVRSLDSNLLNPMYEARTQKAVVEFAWIGGQFLGIPIDQSIHPGSPESPILSSTNLWWGSNILWSLKKYETGERALVLWDVIAALQGLKKSAPAFLGTLMHKWVSDLFSDDSHHVSFNASSHWRGDMMCKVSSRKLHLLNIICRKVMLKDNEQEPGAENFNATDFWNDLLASSERELRERLVSFTFGVVLKRTSCILSGTSVENSWFPVGVAQMDSWVSMHDGELHNQLSSLRCRIQDPGSSLCGTAYAGGMVDKLLSESFFTMPVSPLDADGDDSIDLSAPAVPLCPFCGILLQRSMPEFLLSASPV